MKTLDVYASERHFVDHLAPIWDALPDRARGRFVVPTDAMQQHARSLGIAAEQGLTRRRQPILVSSYGDLKAAREAGRRHIALTEHGYGQSFSSDHPSYAGGRDRDDVGLFLVPNEHAAERDRLRNPKAEIAIVGCPKLDELPARETGTGPTVAISFHWDPGSVAPEARSAWRAYRFGIPSLVREFNLIGHGHPRALKRLSRWYGKFGVEVVPDFADVCRRADVYVCDYSSTIYEFASTGRPVVLMNAPWYRRRVDHGLRYWEAANVGIQVSAWQQLTRAIRQAFTDDAEQRRNREAALAIAYAFRTGAAGRAADALDGWMT